MVRHIADRVAVMYLGKIVEIGDVDDVFDHPTHPYTQALLSAIPIPDPEQGAQPAHGSCCTGDLPSPAEPALRVPVPYPLPEVPDTDRRTAAQCASTWCPTSMT